MQPVVHNQGECEEDLEIVSLGKPIAPSQDAETHLHVPLLRLKVDRVWRQLRHRSVCCWRFRIKLALRPQHKTSPLTQEVPGTPVPAVWLRDKHKNVGDNLGSRSQFLVRALKQGRNIQSDRQGFESTAWDSVLWHEDEPPCHKVSSLTHCALLLNKRQSSILSLLCHIPKPVKAFDAIACNPSARIPDCAGRAMICRGFRTGVDQMLFAQL
ncbi:hypothetical protein VFPPC_08464 [Pochonia chlamydosporia 170]|uniref:Uncharacterized protein n=1 Tax=Pochonia chlamydosporia 170 TaxID=1380566 RepID=A0A179FN44_METCM|nr:hypothetical protein VFPPC_08464 [Pochonia chlamydosporia 170]OAQ66994.2 hypothetical protein VFPPC_08464 [Pochonia chlamydosporia 170]